MEIYGLMSKDFLIEDNFYIIKLITVLDTLDIVADSFNSNVFDSYL
jgi:hypothetical protein